MARVGGASMTPEIRPGSVSETVSISTSWWSSARGSFGCRLSIDKAGKADGVVLLHGGCLKAPVIGRTTDDGAPDPLKADARRAGAFAGPTSSRTWPRPTRRVWELCFEYPPGSRYRRWMRPTNSMLATLRGAFESCSQWRMVEYRMSRRPERRRDGDASSCHHGAVCSFRAS